MNSTKRTESKFESPALEESEFSLSSSFSMFQEIKSPLRLEHGYICICLSGKAEFELNMHHQVCVVPELLILFPHEIITLLNVSNDFSILYIRLSPEFMSEILFGFPPSFIGFIKENSYHRMSENEFNLFYNEFFKGLHSRYLEKENLCRREIIANLLRNFFLDTYDKIKRNESLSRSVRSRKTEIMEQFCELVMKYFKANRDVSFYAEKLFITPKYLSMILKELDVNNRSAKEWIDCHTITEIKLKLKSTNLSVQEISNDFHFPNLSFFCKYFKSRTGLTPKEFRKHIR